MKLLLVSAIFVFYGSLARSQGCSDAGLCTINTLRPSNTVSGTVARNQFRIGASAGSADHDITVFGSSLEYGRQISESFSMDTRVTFLTQTGNNITTSGVGDLYLHGNYTASKKTMLILGIKIPFNKGNKNKGGLPLPMDYQSSLGTVDLLAAFSHSVGKWKFHMGYQQPLTQNANAFFAENYPLHSPLSTFQSTNGYIRKGDILIRVSYFIRLSERLSLTPGILPIYHLGNDEFNNLNGRQVINGSEGLTLNVNGYINYEINKRHALEMSIGSPLVVRDVRPDGLTRGFVVTMQYQLSF